MVAKPGLCVWWDYKRIVHYQLLLSSQIIDSNFYCQQLKKLCQAIEIKRPELIIRKGIIFHHDNVRPYTSLVTHQKLKELAWEVLMYPL